MNIKADIQHIINHVKEIEDNYCSVRAASYIKEIYEYLQSAYDDFDHYIALADEEEHLYLAETAEATAADNRNDYKREADL